MNPCIFKIKASLLYFYPSQSRIGYFGVTPHLLLVLSSVRLIISTSFPLPMSSVSLAALAFLITDWQEGQVSSQIKL